HWAKGEEWAAFAIVHDGKVENGRCSGVALFVPASAETLLLIGDQLLLYTEEELKPYVEPLPTLGLRGAALQTIRLNDMPFPKRVFKTNVSEQALAALWTALASADLIAVAEG